MNASKISIVRWNNHPEKDYANVAFTTGNGEEVTELLYVYELEYLIEELQGILKELKDGSN